MAKIGHENSLFTAGHQDFNQPLSIQRSINKTICYLIIVSFNLYITKAKWSKYPNYKFELISHLKIDNSEIFDTQTWTPKQRCDQVPEGSKHHLPIIILIYKMVLDSP